MLSFKVADTIILAELRQNDECTWDVTIGDCFSGKLSEVSMTSLQLSAVMALAIGYGEDSLAKEEITTELYRIAREALASIPANQWPIP